MMSSKAKKSRFRSHPIAMKHSSQWNWVTNQGTESFLAFASMGRSGEQRAAARRSCPDPAFLPPVKYACDACCNNSGTRAACRRIFEAYAFRECHLIRVTSRLPLYMQLPISASDWNGSAVQNLSRSSTPLKYQRSKSLEGGPSEWP